MKALFVLVILSVICLLDQVYGHHLQQESDADKHKKHHHKISPKAIMKQTKKKNKALKK
jgi:hypothetical protein|tara:strand:+ start:64 stop:240 length:177 start_codon:yes stop_codon:yes gene_type:complete